MSPGNRECKIMANASPAPVGTALPVLRSWCFDRSAIP
jgi:hypothetical protein